MNSVSSIVLIGLTGWTLLLLVLMESVRSKLVLTGSVPANQFKPDNSNLSPFMQRLARAHANCVESVPFFSILLIAAIITNRTDVTDPMSPALLIARIIQSSVHLLSLSVVAVWIRFTAFAFQIAIAVYWTWRLLVG